MSSNHHLALAPANNKDHTIREAAAAFSAQFCVQAGVPETAYVSRGAQPALQGRMLL